MIRFMTRGEYMKSVVALAVTATVWLNVVLLAVPEPQADKNTVTFFVVSDTHYGLSPRGDEEIPKLVDKMNTLPGTEFPAAVGGGKVSAPVGVLHIGDETTTGKKAEWDMFVRDYGLTGKDGKLSYPVYEAFGNHDSDLVRKGVRERNKSRVGIKDLSDNGLHYSWDWNNIHFVCLGVRPGVTKHPYDPDHSIEFLEKDLTKNVAKSGRPVILMHHFGFDKAHSLNWWTDEERTNYYNIIKDYNVIGIIHGHAHKPEIYQWNGIDIYHPPHFRQDKPKENGPVTHGFFVFRITADELIVAERKWDDTWGMTSRKKIKSEVVK
jgi:predicted phosphodiesterase